ncbi:MAG TPA: fructosamine kinase family protein [Mycobacteriales bacterium]|nr:fructosamine kinase family protein [Mycobacteriales bacterium]
MRVAGIDLAGATPIGGGDICRAFDARTTSGVRVFAKTLADAPEGFFEAEAAGLDRLRVDGGPRIPEVVAAGVDGLVLEWIEPGPADAGRAAEFGRALARMHRAGGETFGVDVDGFVATVPLDNSPTDDWAAFHGERRLRPALRLAVERHAIVPDDAAAVSDVVDRLGALAGPRVRPACLHGDLWAGNLVWSADESVWLVDAAAAHFGNRETDLAMLMLFGAPYLEEIFAGYDEVYARDTGWAGRVALHQVHPLLIHASLFGGGYGARAGKAARSALAGAA